MNPVKMWKIEVDQEVYEFLKRSAEPFVETNPNSVLRRLLPLEAKTPIQGNDDVPKIFPEFSPSVPNALAETLEMIILVKKAGLSRVQATHTVADIRGISTQAVLDKYCRQLDKRAHEVDELLMASNLDKFKGLLIEKYGYHKVTIENIFKNISTEVNI